ncbi:MAG: AgmX/PglI C-terminal domain-containing protein [Deltaproteobacteria bacterium]|nr:AgmX/PglI C-terminal domain-containing protein [Deltaproteobacteria bacterium]
MNDRSHCLEVRELLIAYRAGEVTPLQRQRVEVHLAGCASCKAELAFESELERTARAGPEPLTDTRKRQILGQIHERLEHEQQRAPFWRRPVVWAPATGFAAAAAALLLVLSLPEPLPVQEGWLETQRGIEAFATEAAQVRFEESDEGPVIHLGAQAVLARYQRRPGQRPLRVRTPHGDAIIRGTIFFVDVQADRTEVGVQKGTVEVVDRAGHSILVGAGEQARSTAERVEAVEATSPRFARLRETFPSEPVAVAAAEEPAPPRQHFRRPRRAAEEPAPEPEPLPEPVAEDPGPDPALLATIVGRHLPIFQSCYERGLKNHPALQGRMVAEVSYGTDGVIFDGTFLVDELQTPEVTACLANNLLDVRFPPATSVVTLEIPLVFEPGGVRHDRQAR